MSLDNDELSCDTTLEACPELSTSSRSSSFSPNTVFCDHDQKRDGHVSVDDDDVSNLGEFMNDVQFMLEEDSITELMKERDQWRTQATKSAERIATLEKRMAVKAATGLLIDPDFVGRLNFLEQEHKRLTSENLRLKEEMQDTDRKNTLLCNDNEGKSRKFRGANKKAMTAKDAAVKEEKKAKEAVHERNERLKLQREQQKLMKEAKAKVAEKEKIIQNLLADLDTEREGSPHLRDEGSPADETTAAFSVSLNINRKHFPLLKSMLAENQAAMQNRIQKWYKQWNKPQEKQMVGAMSTGAPDKTIMGDLFDEFLETEGYPSTGAEHDGRRSMRGLEAIARHATTAHNDAT